MKGTMYNSPVVLVIEKTKKGSFKNLVLSLKELVFKPRYAEWHEPANEVRCLLHFSFSCLSQISK